MGINYIDGYMLLIKGALDLMEVIWIAEAWMIRLNLKGKAGVIR